MGFQATDWALRGKDAREKLIGKLEDPGGGPPVRAHVAAVVLVTLAHHVNERDGLNQCFPSVRTIAEESRLSPRSVHRALDVLESLDLIKPVGRREGGPVIYRLAVTEGVHNMQGSAHGAGGGLHMVQGGSAQRADKQEGNTKTEESAPAVVEEVIEAWVKAKGSSAQMTSARIRAITSKPASDFPTRDLVDAVRGACLEEKSFFRSMDIARLLSRPEYIEECRDAYRASPHYSGPDQLARINAGLMSREERIRLMNRGLKGAA